MVRSWRRNQCRDDRPEYLRLGQSRHVARRREVLGHGDAAGSNNSLASDTEGQLSAGGGFADFFFNRSSSAGPPIVWTSEPRMACSRRRAGSMPGHPTTSAPDTGPMRRQSALTIFLHERQNDDDLGISHVRVSHGPGGNGHSSRPDRQHRLLLARTFRVNDDTQLQLGLIGYGQWQTTDKTGPTITAARGQRALPGQCAGLRVERRAAGAEGEPGPEVLQGVLEPIDLSGLHTADRGRGHVLG